MKRAMTYVAVWGGATALAMLLVWFGARPVLHNAVFGAPPARPIVGGPSSSPSASPATPTSPDGESSTIATTSATPSPSPTTQQQDRTYLVKGGKIVLTMTPTVARLVSATPNPGYEVRTWNATGWLRVDFVDDRHESSLFATWNGHAPTVQVQY